MAGFRPAIVLVVTLVVTSGVASHAAAEPVVTETVEYYDVQGSTPQEVRAQINQQGPIDAVDGKHYDATTRWFVNWRYNYRTAAGQCSLSGVSTTVKITIIMPRLSRDSPAAVQQAFGTYARNLLTHEKGHAQNGIEISRRIEARFAAMTPQPDCERLGQAANDLGNSLIKEANQEDIAYDARTQHGRTQGARFP